MERADQEQDEVGSFPGGEVVEISAADRVFRGGARIAGTSQCTSVFRAGNNPSGRGGGLGFRPALTLSMNQVGSFPGGEPTQQRAGVLVALQINRGGNWRYSTLYCSSIIRGDTSQLRRDGHRGFRPSLTLATGEVSSYPDGEVSFSVEDLYQVRKGGSWSNWHNQSRPSKGVLQSDYHGNGYPLSRSPITGFRPGLTLGFSQVGSLPGGEPLKLEEHGEAGTPVARGAGGVWTPFHIMIPAMRTSLRIRGDVDQGFRPGLTLQMLVGSLPDGSPQPEIEPSSLRIRRGMTARIPDNRPRWDTWTAVVQIDTTGFRPCLVLQMEVGSLPDGAPNAPKSKHWRDNEHPERGLAFTSGRITERGARAHQRTHWQPMVRHDDTGCRPAKTLTQEVGLLPDGTPIQDPRASRVLRSAAWSTNDRESLQSAYRFYYTKPLRSTSVGFRVVLVLDN